MADEKTKATNSLADNPIALLLSALTQNPEMVEAFKTLVINQAIESTDRRIKKENEFEANKRIRAANAKAAERRLQNIADEQAACSHIKQNGNESTLVGFKYLGGAILLTCLNCGKSYTNINDIPEIVRVRIDWNNAIGDSLAQDLSNFD